MRNSCLIFASAINLSRIEFSFLRLELGKFRDRTGGPGGLPPGLGLGKLRNRTGGPGGLPPGLGLGKLRKHTGCPGGSGLGD